MPYKLHISEEEVREELRRQGYGEVPEEMVASFRRDLLRLIKADIKHLKKVRAQHSESSSSPTSSGLTDNYTNLASRTSASTGTSYSNSGSSRSTTSSSQQDSGSSLSEHTTSTPLPRVQSYPSPTSGTYTSSFETSSQSASHGIDSTAGSSIPSSAQGLQRQIDKQLRRSQRRKLSSPSSSESDDGESGYSEDSGSTAASSTPASSRRPQSSSSTSSGVSSAASGVTSGEGRKSRGITIKPGPATKRAPSLPCYPRRPDPVSLYHYYKSHWDLHPAPGEDPRAALRWQVRADLFYSK